MFKHLLIPTDGSEAALRALQQGAQLALTLGAQVTVVRVVVPFHGGILGSALDSDDHAFDQAGDAVAIAELEAAAQQVSAVGVPCQRILLKEKSVYQAILDAASSCGADLIVMGTHDMGTLERFLMGSQTQRVMAHTRLAVLSLH